MPKDLEKSVKLQKMKIMSSKKDNSKKNVIL